MTIADRANGHRLLPVASALIAACCSAASLLAQASQNQPTFRSSVRLVRLSVSVLDKSRAPVRGLTRADFSVRVDGVEQPIVEALEIDHGGPEGIPQEDVPTQGIANTRHEQRAFVLILDDANTHNDAQMMADVKNAGKAFLAGLETSDLAAVVFTWNGRHNVDFTRDRARLRNAVDQFRPGPGEAEARRHPSFAEDALNATVRHAVSSLRLVNDAQPAVLLLSPGPKRALRGANTSRDLAADDDAAQGFLDGMTLGSELAEASYSNVPIYAISTWGLRPPGPLHPVFRYDPLMNAVKWGNDYLHTVANLTGGRAFTDRNDVAVAARQILRELELTYLIGYSPTYPVTDGRIRRIQDVARPGVQVIPSDRRLRSPRQP